MKALKDVQQTMMDSLSQSKIKLTPDFISGTNKLIPNPLDIYRQSILGNHLSAFSEVYPVIFQLVGESFFEHVFYHFYDLNPHESYDVSDYGEGFADFLEGFKACDSLPYLPDVARLEWYCHKASLGPNYQVADFEALTRMDESMLQSLCFEMPPNSFLLKSAYPVLRIFEVNQLNKPEVEPIDMDKEGGCQLFVWRSGLDLRIESINQSEYFCLSCFQQGYSLEKTIQVLEEKYGVSNSLSQNILSKCLQKGWLVGFNVLE